MRMSATMQAMRHGVTVMFVLALLFFLSSPVSAEEQIRHSILIIYPFDRALPVQCKVSFRD